MTAPETIAFIERVVALDKIGKINKTLDEIFGHIDDLLLAGKFHAVDNVLLKAESYTLSPDALLGFLTITLAAHSRLQRRVDFYMHVEKVVLATRDAKHAELALAGLERPL